MSWIITVYEAGGARGREELAGLLDDEPSLRGRLAPAGVDDRPLGEDLAG